MQLVRDRAFSSRVEEGRRWSGAQRRVDGVRFQALRKLSTASCAFYGWCSNERYFFGVFFSFSFFLIIGRQRTVAETFFHTK